MAMRIIIISMLCFLQYQLILAEELDLFNKVKSHTNLQEDELLVVTYQNPATCTKCYIEPMDIISRIEKLKEQKKLKFLALVKCDREIELKVFKREIGWKYHLYVDDGTARKQFKVPGNSIISILNSKGKVLLNLTAGKIEENLKKTKEFFDSH